MKKSKNSQKNKFLTDEDLKNVYVFPEKESVNLKKESAKYSANLVVEKSLLWKKP